MIDSYSFNSVNYDFEEYVMKKMLPPCDPNDNPNNKQETPYIKADPRHRIIVCQHWLLGLCQVGNDCTYLHRFDKNKMPQCKHGKGCKIKNCPLKHGDNEVLECIFYRQGFCLNGPMCSRRHIVKRPEECPQEATFEAAYYSSGGGGATNSGPANKKPRTNQPNENYKVSLCTHWLQTGTCTFDEGCHFAHGEEEIHDGVALSGSNIADLTAEAEIYDPTRFRMDAPLKMPFTQQDKISYFILHSPDLRSLRISRRRGRWAVPYWLRDDLNNALNTSKHVIIFFSVRSLRGIYGVARMTGEVLPPVMGSPMSREFTISWLRTIRIALRTVSQMKVAASGMFIGKNQVDCKLDSRVGLDLLYISYRKPEWDWTTEYERASQLPSNINDPSVFESQAIAESLHPDQLFSDEWMNKVSIPPSDQKYRSDRGDRFSSGSYSNNQPYNDRKSYQSTNLSDPNAFYYNGDAPGFVFCSTTPVVQEMLAKGLLALPPNMGNVVINPASPLFLFDLDAKLLFGVFQANCPLTENLDPIAFKNWFPNNNAMNSSPLPYQLRFQPVIRCNPISIFEPDYVNAMGKIHLGGEMRLRDTKHLVNVFAVRAGLFIGGGALMAQNPSSQGFDRSHPSFYRPPFKNVEIVPLSINADINEVKKRVLGINAINVLQIVDEIGASKNQVKIRLRGIGSGFMEGPSELPEPLHFNISAETEQLLRSVVDKVKAWIAKCKIELERS